MTGSTLLQRPVSDIVAVDAQGPIAAGDFLARVRVLAKQLPSAPCAINLCRDRVNFLTAFAAVIAAGQYNLLPPNRQHGAVRSIAARYDGCYVIHDGSDDVPDMSNVCVDALAPVASTPAESVNPTIDDGQLCAISFTSGSTGESQPNLKYWSTLRESSHINRRYMLKDYQHPQSMIATVPPQHMWGLETSVLLALFANVTVHTGQPLYPLDVAQQLATLTPPRVLVSTPAHLRVLISSAVEFPKVQRVLSATAPLDAVLAQQTEQSFDAELIEIYGCSEGGSLAARRTARETGWQPFDAMHFESSDNGCVLSADHLPAAVALQDYFEFDADGRFTLAGRRGDLINIAGKRGSLSELNHHLLNIKGVVDGIIFEPDPDSTVQHTHRLAALIVAPTLDAKAIAAAMSAYVDPVFVPRPMVFVDALPRSESSKLPRQALLDEFARARRRST